MTIAAPACCPGESARQSEILDRALDLVREKGLAALTTKKVAERVGFTEAALYRHFSSKKVLILGLMDRLEAMLIEPIREIAADGTRSPSERLEMIVRHHVSLVREQNSLPILLLAEASVSEDPQLLGRMRSIFHAYLSILEGLLREGQTRGEITRDVTADSLALVLLGAPAALAIRHRLLPDATAEDRFEHTLVPYLLTALSTSKGRTA
ncbi:MAG TPA: TetR/AcrR family transcriptional regulator [Acidobacteria bacterium]|nr:TetR/AcrR family transcriptional regulator [Acidobacteriota bacterium]